MEKRTTRHKKMLVCGILCGVLAGGTGLSEGALPDYFDYRRTKYTDKTSEITTTIVPSVWDQGHYGACWTFAALASYESNWNLQLEKAGITGSAPNLSERYIAWLAYEPPLDGTWKDRKYYSPTTQEYDDNKNPYPYEKNIFEQGGYSEIAFIAMARWGNALDSQYPYDSTDETMKGIESIVPSQGSVHDLYSIGFKSDVTADYLKQLVKDAGVLSIGVDTSFMSNDKKELYKPGTNHHTTHAVSIVGWDDNYVFTNFTNKNGSPIVGAWIVRNSWGAKAGDVGYFYIPLQDNSFKLRGIFNPEPDSMRYTQLETNTYSVPDDTTGDYTNAANNQVAYANKLTATAPQMLKATTFYVSNDSTSYKIEVLTDMSSPTDGRTVYTQEGTFGKDTTLAYKGYRTVDFNKYVFLPKDKEYMIKLTLTAADGKEQVVKYQYDTSTITSTPGLCFVYDADDNGWVDLYYLSKEQGEKNQTILTYGRSKDSALANGGDFTVCYLNDGGVGGSYVNLGSASELYGTDPLHPNRTTLSNMTVDLTAGLTDSVYGGVIYGEGGLTKTGTGILTLMGDNLYTGDTKINQGTLSLIRKGDGTGGSVQSAVYVNTDGTLTGNGTIYNDLTNSGNVEPGDGIGTITVHNYVQTATGNLNLQGGTNVSDVLNVLGTSHIEGEVHFIPFGYFANGENVLRVNESDLQYGNNLTITGEDANTRTVSVIATSTSVADKSCTFTATRAANAYSNIATTEDGLTLGKVLDKVAGYQTGDGQNLVAGIDFYDYNLDNLGTKMQPRAYDSLMTANMKTQRFVGKNLVDTMLSGDNYTLKTPDEKSDGIFAKALRYSSHQNGWEKYDSYDNLVSGVLVGYEREANGWKYGVHGAYLSGSADVNSAAPLHNDYYSGTVGVHGIKNMDRDFLYGFVQGSWERNEANRKVSYDTFSRRQEAKWNGTGFSLEVGGGHNFRSEKRHQSLTPYASLNYSRLHWGSIDEDCSAGDSTSISRDSNNYNSLVGTLGLRAQIGPHKMTGNSAKISYDTTVAYEHEFLNNMSGYNYTVLGTNLYQDGYKKPARDVVSVSVGANIMDGKKFTLRADLGKSWGSQGYTALTAGLKGQWKF